MSFQDITIVRQIPIINNFCQLADNLEQNRSAVSLEAFLAADPTASIVRMSAGTGGARTAGSKHGLQEWLELGETVACCNNDEAVEDGKALQPSRVPDPPPPGEGEYNELPCGCTRELMASTYTVDLIAFNGIEGCCTRGVDLIASTVFLTGGDDCLWTATEQDYAFTLQLITNDDGTCYWSLEILCPDTTVVWSGTKLTGSGPNGTYTGATGCATTNYPTIDILAIV
jgi:hypothetical protein